MATKIDLVGKQFGKLKVVSEVQERHNKNIYWLNFAVYFFNWC